MQYLLRTIALLLLGTSLLHAYGQAVVVSSYYNALDVRDEWIELLVVTDNTDIRGWTLRDNNATQDAFQTSVTFTNHPLWNNLRAGTIIQLYNRQVDALGVAIATDIDKADGYLQVHAQQAAYFTGGAFGAAPSWAGNTLNFSGNGDIVQLLDASLVHVHALGHKFTVGPDFTALPLPKLNHTQSLNSGEVCLVCPGATLADYGSTAPTSGTVFTAKSTTVDIGLPNACTASATANTIYWRTLREPLFASQLVTPTPVVVGTPGSISFSWTAATDPVPADGTTGYIVLRNTVNTFIDPADGTSYTNGSPLGSATVLAHIASSSTTSYTDATVMNGNEYYYRVYAYRYSTDQPNGNSYHPARGRAYTATFVSVQSLLLPITLLRFDAERNGADAQLTWSTASEENNAYFTLEKSLDGGTWQPLAQEAGCGTCYYENQYSWIDEDINPGTHTYRLWQTDTDGTRTYCGERSLELAAAAPTLVPRGNGQWEAIGFLGETLHIVYYDTAGRLLLRAALPNISPVVLPPLPQGATAVLVHVYTAYSEYVGKISGLGN